MRKAIAFVLAIMLVLPAATGVLATNGMNLEGYGPISAGMGGASFAFYNGTAAMMNNPATLALFPDGYHLDLALGFLGPDVKASVATPAGTMSATSLSDAFYMPAVGFFVKQGQYGYGFGIYGQGGMGTEFAADSWMADPSMGANTALEGGLVNRSEVSVGRAIVPFTYDVSEQLHLGLSVDFVWAGLDLQMAMSEAQFQDLANPMAQTLGTASGTLVDAFGQLYEPFGGTGVRTLYHAYFDFSNDSDFFGLAKGYGFAGKIGGTYQVLPNLTVGATFHTPTWLGDLETDEAVLQMGVDVDPGVFQGAPTGNYMDMNIDVTGTVTINDFQWPWIVGAGAAWEPIEPLMLAADVKLIGWSSVMEDFSMTFTADDSPENGAFAGLAMDAVLTQKWENQVVLSLGGAYKATKDLTLRAGYNYGKNPIPDTYLNPLFPAIVENHLTLGAGYDFAGANSINASFQTAFEKEATNPGNGTTIPAVTSTHSQMNWMVMYSRSF